ncbi:virion structural protein [Erwinia phage Faunus]|uniref:Uncharacterized protein n=1 Tax=Erwinia phage Faunus TaxID=2182346 RepID=A0A2U8UWL7_9CAUD|nr:virion structural protein [Erwinia phage Faunus]AWN08649.1 hypothetical protein [Erwinia phage Faunus]
MSATSERQALTEIASLLPPGYVKTVPFSVKNEVTFEYKGVLVKLSPIYLNEDMNCYMVDLSWGSTNKLYGLPIKCGLDILRQFDGPPLPNLYAANGDFPGEDITSWRNLSLFVIDVSVLENG